MSENLYARKGVAPPEQVNAYWMRRGKSVCRRCGGLVDGTAKANGVLMCPACVERVRLEERAAGIAPTQARLDVE